VEARLSVLLGGGGGGGLACVGTGGAAPGIGGGGRLFLLLFCGDDPGEARGMSSPRYELRLSLEKRGDVGKGGDAIGIGGGTRLVGEVSALGVSSDMEGYSDISSSDSEPMLGETRAAGGGGRGRAENKS
jgi:hypothetical protein